MRGFREEFKKVYAKDSKLTDKQVYEAFQEAYDYSSDAKSTDANTVELMKEWEDAGK